MAREDFAFEDRVRAGLEGEDLTGAEIRLKVSGQVRVQVKKREQVIGNGLSAKIPQHGAQFVVLVEADAVVDGEKLMCVRREENVTTLAQERNGRIRAGMEGGTCQDRCQLAGPHGTW